MIDPGEIEEIRKSLQEIASNTSRLVDVLEILASCVSEEDRLKVSALTKDMSAKY
jgi:hypothetical protein